MTGDVVNLRTARKAREKDAAKVAADANAAKFGRAKGEKLRDEVAAEKARRDLDGHHRE